jgi:hypothetical protein
MIANGHFCWPPTIPTLVRARSRRRPREAELHAENRGGIDRSADRPVADRVGRVAMTCCSPDRRSPATGSNLSSRPTTNGGPK